MITERDYIIIDNEKVYLWFDLYEDGYKDGNIIQNFNLSYIEFTYNDTDIDFKEKEIKAYKEKLNGETWETTFENTFIVTAVTPNNTDRTTKVKAYDLGLKFSVPYKTELNYASGLVTMQMVSDEITTRAGMPSAILDVNGDFIFTSDQFTNAGAYDGNVIAYIAGMSGNRARIFEDKLVYQFVNETNKVINVSDYEKLEDKRDTHPFTILVIGQSNIEGGEAVRRDEALIAEYGENYLRIMDNPIAYTQEKREQLIDGIFNKIKGFGYSSFVATGTNLIDYNIGDKIKFETADGTLVDSVILRKSSKSTEITLEAPSIINATIDYSMPQTAMSVAQRAEIIVNQQEQKITSIVEQQSEQSSQITTIEQDIETIEAKLENISDYTDSKTEFNSIHLTGTVGGVEEPHQYGYVLDFKVYGSVNWKYDYPKNDYPQNDYPINNIPQLVVSSTPKGDLSGDYMFVPLNLEEPLYAYVNGGLVIRDELYIQNVDGLVVSTLTKRIERLADGTLQLLATPIVKDVGQILIPTYADNTYIYVRSINDVEYYVRWLLENDYSGVFATKVEVTNRIEIAEEGILLEAQTAIDTATEPVNLVSQINLLPEGSIKMNASNTIDLTSLNINMTADNVTIDSDNFSVDSEGNITANNGSLQNITIRDGVIELSKLEEDAAFKVKDEDGFATNINGANFIIEKFGEKNKVIISSNVVDSSLILTGYDSDYNIDSTIYLSSGGTSSFTGNIATERGSITAWENNMYANNFIPNSREELKENIKPNEKGLKLIEKIDTYTYNFKNGQDKKEKIGFIIGEKYNLPEELISYDEKGIELYSSIAVCVKAIQELYDIIKVQQEEIKELKAMIKKESD